MRNKEDLVKQSYNKIAKNYLAKRDQFQNQKYLDKLINVLKPGSVILDIGCGSGIPIDRYFLGRGHKVIGVDISEEQIKLAKINVPEGNYEVKNMTALSPSEYRVDAIVSFYAIFHIPRERHENLFKIISNYLSDGGLLLVTMGSVEWEGFEDDFHGSSMYWSHFGKEKNEEIINAAGFKILMSEIDKSANEKHLVVFAEKLHESESVK